MIKQISNTDYPIYLGTIFDKMDAFIQEMQPEVSHIYILVDENTHTHCISPLVMNVSIIEQAELLEIDAGEEHKNLEIVNHLWLALAENNVDRNALIINLGGGVVSDLGGFMASVYKRGIRFINLPTTLLSMVDAAIGGKTGVDLGALKNQIGCFSNPQAVFIAPEFLETLPTQQLKSGFGELLKYSLIDHPELWSEFQTIDFEKPTNLDALIESSLEIKTKIVAEDPKEKGLRKILNFGHTYGHAFESLSLMQSPDNALLHGEAVAMGIVCELWHSVQKVGFPNHEFAQIKEFVFQNFRSFAIDSNQVDLLIDLMKKDKKNAGDQIAVVLLEQIGKPRFDSYINENEIRECLNFYINQ
jgi:3-dehydroquinate synthase